MIGTLDAPRLVAGRLAPGVGTAVGRVATPLAGEAGSEMLEEGGIHALTNLYSGDPVMQGTGGAAAMGGLLGLAWAAHRLAWSWPACWANPPRGTARSTPSYCAALPPSWAEPLVDTEQDTAPQQPPPAPEPRPDAAAPEDTADLEALLVQNVLGGEPEAQDFVDRVRALFEGEAPTTPDTGRLPPLDDQQDSQAAAPATRTPAEAGQAPVPQAAPAAAGADLPTGALYQRGNGRNRSSAQALQTPDGTWYVRNRTSGR